MFQPRKTLQEPRKIYGIKSVQLHVSRVAMADGIAGSLQLAHAGRCEDDAAYAAACPKSFIRSVDDRIRSHVCDTDFLYTDRIHPKYLQIPSFLHNNRKTGRRQQIVVRYNGLCGLSPTGFLRMIRICREIITQNTSPRESILLTFQIKTKRRHLSINHVFLDIRQVY